MQPSTEFTLIITSIAWSAWGVGVALELYPYAPSWRWKAFIIAMSGPAVWGISLYRGVRALRHRILHHFGVEHCCCHH